MDFACAGLRVVVDGVDQDEASNRIQLAAHRGGSLQSLIVGFTCFLVVQAATPTPMDQGEDEDKGPKKRKLSMSGSSSTAVSSLPRPTSRPPAASSSSSTEKKSTPKAELDEVCCGWLLNCCSLGCVCLCVRCFCVGIVV
jgi:hypothetical protein